MGQPANAGRRLLTATWHERWGVLERGVDNGSTTLRFIGMREPAMKGFGSLPRVGFKSGSGQQQVWLQVAAESMLTNKVCCGLLGVCEGSAFWFKCGQVNDFLEASAG